MLESNKFSKNYNFQEEKIDKPTILMVGPLPPPSGGISTVVQGLLKSSLLKSKYKFFHVDNSTSRPRIKKGKIDPINLFAFAKQSILLSFAILKYNPDIVHIHTSGKISFFKNSIFVLIAKFFNKKILFSLHASSNDFFIKSHQFFIKRYTKIILTICNLTQVLSYRGASLLNENFYIPQSKFTIIPNIVNEEDLAVIQKGSADYHEGNDAHVLIHVGCLGKQKGTFDLIKSAGILKSEGFVLNVFLVGPPVREGVLKKIQCICGEETVTDIVKITGETDHIEVLHLMSISDIFVLPTYSEGLPVSLLEAMAASLPVVVTPIGGIPEVVKDGENGLLVKPGDVKALTKAIKRLILDENLRKKMGVRNKAKIIAQYTMDVQAKNFYNAYRVILEE